MNNIDYIDEGSDLDELLKKISATYKECNKYDEYIEKDKEFIEDDDIDEEQMNDKKKKKKNSNNYYNKNEYTLNNNMNKYTSDNNKNFNVTNKKAESINKFDDLKNIIMNEKKR
ncbi:hypothetical protein PGSY75_1203100, partial [Plasmodium gaboni]